MTLQAAVAVRDITPGPGAPMAGYAARTQPAQGTHDPLTVRALVVENTALVTIDVVALDADTCRRIRSRCAGIADVVVHAIHTHSGPVSTPGGLGESCDREWFQSVEDAAVDAIHEGAALLEPVTVATSAATSDMATNRRRTEGPVDPSVPVVTMTRPDGTTLATVVSYACHPVVLGADNLLLSPDFPGQLRERIEAETGGPALFLTGCAGDANPAGVDVDPATAAAGHDRTFADCAAVGEQLAQAALEGIRDARRRSSASEGSSASSRATGASIRRGQVTLDYALPTPGALHEEVSRWHEQAQNAPDAGQRALYSCWEAWARTQLEDSGRMGRYRPWSWTGSVALLTWGPATIVALPGEPFARTGIELRHQLDLPEAIVAGYCDGCPGYLPMADEYDRGGYEVDDAHRYYGAPGPFAAGSAERLLAATADLTNRAD